MYFRRKIQEVMAKACRQFPAVLVTGGRQAGKSTLLQHALPDHGYVSLDDAMVRAAALKDPDLFLSLHPAPLIIDEIQYAPELLSQIKLRVDADRRKFGQYVLTGSQVFPMMQGVSESLAGRVAILELFPFSWEEIEMMPGKQGGMLDEPTVVRQMVQGFYPEFFRAEELDWGLWYSAYVSTYLERDVRGVKAVEDLSRFQAFMTLLAARAGQLLNLSEVAKECGISQPTAKNWLSILQATYVIYLLQPYHNNLTKRVVKTPKLYFVDTGLLCYLAGIDSGRRLIRSRERGHIFENMVVMEAVKHFAGMGKRPRLYFYRTHGGTEVDLIIDRGDELEANEIKFAKTVDRGAAASLIKFVEAHPGARGRVLCMRSDELPLAGEIQLSHWSRVTREAATQEGE